MNRRRVLGSFVDLKSLDGILELSWHTDQLHRIGTGLKPDLGRGRIATTLAMLPRKIVRGSASPWASVVSALWAIASGRPAVARARGSPRKSSGAAVMACVSVRPSSTPSTGLMRLMSMFSSVRKPLSASQIAERRATS